MFARTAACTALIVIAVPVTYIVNLDRGMDALPAIPHEPAQRKRVFFDYLRPIVRQQNAYIREERALFIGLASKARLSWYERLRWSHLLRRYRVDEALGHAEQRNLLDRRIREVPEALVLAQAAKESAWGRSRFAREGNALFGERCFIKGCGIVPRKRAPGKRHEVESFNSVADSVESYLLNLNSHRRYAELRTERQRLVDGGQPVTGIALAPYTVAYSERRGKYTKEIANLIRRNELDPGG